MPTVDHVVETEISRSIRARQLESAFDVPPSERSRLEWHGDVPYDAAAWNVGLILGPSGSGKSTLLHAMFGDALRIDWYGAAVVDDFAEGLTLEEICATCQAVGFNTIPAWLRPHKVLSTGERFRADLARRMIETPPNQPIIVDEFTSVVDRQVAQIASHAVQKWVRKRERQIVCASCHYDIVDWLQPDWTFEPATMTFTRRSLHRRPDIHVEIARVDYAAWQLFARFHYLTSDMHRAARSFVLFVNGTPASFAGVLKRPHPTARDVFGLTRGVTLPDFQGMGLAFVLFDTLGSAYRAIGQRLHLYPAHPAFIRSADHSPNWSMRKAPGRIVPLGRTSSIRKTGKGKEGFFLQGNGARVEARPCAIFEYVGPIMTERRLAQALIDGEMKAAA
jgi:ABC-type ATPase involved in cell division